MSALRPSNGQHLDATAGREVVFCHSCSYEWFRDEQGLVCPRCQSEISELVNPMEDPRDLSRPIPPYPRQTAARSTSNRHQSPHEDGDSDPEEADIEEHLGPHGFAYRRATSTAHDDNHIDDHHHHDQGQGQEYEHAHEHIPNPPVDPVLQRFADMLQGFGSPGRTGGPMNFRGNGHTVQRTTFTSRTMGGGTASVTIFSGPAPHFRRQAPEDNDPFQAFFNSTMRDMGPPPAAHPQPGAGDAQMPGFARTLQDILNLFHPANAAHGDAVYSQEALDRIITSLMEQNPQSNAAPPASDQALQNLDRREVTSDMLGDDGAADCSICLDNYKEGEVVIFLPCKHWFHDKCVILWLQEHNTCPVCRTPIENRGQQNASSQGGNGQGTNDQGNPPAQHGQAGPDSAGPNPNPSDPFAGPGSASAVPDNAPWQTMMRSSFMRRGLETPVVYRFSTGPAPSRPTTLSRPPSQSQTPLNQVMRDISSSQREQQRTRDREAVTEQSYDTSRMQQRRTSLSPTAPRTYTAAEQGARMRQRSPSSSERRRTPPEQGSSSRSSGGGPLGWLRDRLGGSQREGRGP
ncbi:hypothetical protein CC79DRAFT_1370005 [Sarocladium strictum]